MRVRGWSVALVMVLLPSLARAGYRGPIFATPASAD